MTFSSNPIVCSILVFAILTYLVSVNYLIDYLRRAYTMTWMELGGFSLWDVRRKQITGLVEWYFAGLRTIGFIIFSNQYRSAQDRRLTVLIWVVRVSFGVGLLLMLTVMTQPLVVSKLPSPFR
jgi:hypothetical protein